MIERIRSNPAVAGAIGVVVALVVGLGTYALLSGDDEAAVAPTSVPVTVGTVPPTSPATDATSAPPLPTTDSPLDIPQPPYTVATPAADGQLAIYDQPWGAVVKGLANPKLINDDPNAPVPLTLLVKGRSDDGWLEVWLPVRPNGSTGWVRASDVTTIQHDYRIEVALDEFTLRLYDGQDVAFEAPVAVAADNTPTPGGIYYTTELIRPVDAPNGPYGTYAYGLSGYSDVWQSFNGGPGQLGIHGTNQPEKMGQQVSNGCVRMRNQDIDRLAESIGLPLGVPVVVLD